MKRKLAAGRGLLILSAGLYLGLLGTATAGTVITGATTLSADVYNGHQQSGYFVRSGELDVTNATFTNYRTVGGSGSGGGGGLGGVIFINDGATVVLKNVVFSGNTAVGGASVAGALRGGVVNNILSATSNGSSGSTGDHYANSDSDFVVGDGAGNGVGGDPGHDGGDAADGFGGHGGTGGYGTTGWGHNPILQEAVASATTATFFATVDLVQAGIDATEKETLSAALSTASGTCLPGLCGPGLAAAAAATLVSGLAKLVAVGTATTNLAFAAADLAFAAGALDKWNNDNNSGANGIGGDGGEGGVGGDGSFGFGGGIGGTGGDGGDHGGPAARDGSGGDGGAGGAGGFGAGGGAGGVAGDGEGRYRGHDYSGADGDGGEAGFGGGVGSAGGAADGGGGGGSGYGGSIFVASGGTLLIQGNATFERGNVVGGRSQTGGLAGDTAGSDIFLQSGASVTLDAGLGKVQTFNGTIADDSIASIGNSGYQYGQGADVTIVSGLIVFNGANTYSGNTIITGGALQAQDGVGLFANSNLVFDGPGTNGGVLQSSGTFDRYVGTVSDRVQWTGSGGFAAVGGGLTVSLNGGAQLTWDEDSFVPNGNALIFGSPTATAGVLWTNDIDLNGATRTILVDANANQSDYAEISGVLSNGGLTVGNATHSGVLVLTGVNTYTGPTTIVSGATLVLAGDGSIAASANVTNNGVFDIASTDAGASLVTLQGSGSVWLGSQTLTLTNASTTFSGVIDGDGGVDVAGGTQTFSGANLYSGPTVVEDGATLILAGGGSVAPSIKMTVDGTFDISTTASGAQITTLDGAGVVVLGDKTLTLTNASTTFDGVIGGTGGLKITGGIETLTGTNTYTGITWIGAGDPPGLALKGTGSIALSAGVVDNSIFDISATTAGAAITTLSGYGTVLLGAQTLTLTAANDLFSGVISGSGGLTVAVGTETLSGVNTYTGPTVINGGASLVLTGAGAIATSAGVTDNGTFDISATNSGASIKTLNGNGVVVLGNKTLSLSSAHDVFDGVIGGTGGLTVNAGSETLTDTNTYTGSTTIDAGATLKLTGTGSIATSQVVVADGTFDISGTSAGASIITLAGTGSVVLGAERLTLTDASTTFAGVMSGTEGVTVAGGTETFTGTNTYTGRTIINTGTTLALAGTGSVATSSGVTDNGTFDISATTAGASIKTLDGNGVVALGSQILILTAASETFDGVIGGSGGLTVAAGTETLTGTNTYTGGTTIDAGAALFLTGTGSIATSSVVTDNGTFDISGTSAGASIVTLAGNGSVVLGAERLTLSNASTTFDGVISGSEGVTVAAGTETFTGTNTYTGRTIIDAGATLALSGTGSVATSSGVTDNGTFDISATTAGASIKTLDGNGSVKLGAQTLTLTAASETFAGVISGSGGLTLAAGSETLTGANTFTGTTTISAGTLSIGDGGGTGSLGTGNIVDNSALVFNRSGALSVVGAISGTGTVSQIGSGVTTVSGASTYSGLTTVAAGTLKAGAAGVFSAASSYAVAATLDLNSFNQTIGSLSGAGSVTLGSAILTVGADNSSKTFSGVISGSGALVKTGSGTQTLSGVNTYTGGTTISSGGTLALSGPGSIATSSGVIDSGIFDISGTTAGASIKTLSGAGTVALGAKVLTLTTASGTFSGVIGGSGGVAVTGGTETLTGTNTYSGGTTIANATLKVNGNAALGAASGTVAMNNGTLVALAGFTANRATTLTGANTINTNALAVTWNGVVGGAGSLIADGGGTLTLAGANTYAGGTSIVNHTTVSVCSDANLGAPGGPLTITDGLLVVTCGLSTSRTIALNGTGRIDSGGNALDITGPVSLNPGNGPINLYTGTIHTTGAWTLDAQNGLYVSGTLSGVGTVSQNTTVAGTLSPGNSPGTITFLASVVMLPASFTNLDVDGPGTGTGAGNYDRIVVQGAGHTFTAGGQMVVKLRGITGAANNTFTPVVGQRFNVVHTDAGVIASYAGLTQPTSGLAAGTQFDAVYSDSDIDLVATPVSYANLTPIGVTDTANRMSLGGAINSYRLAPGVRMTGDRNPVLTALYSLPAGSIGASMDQIAGSVHGDVMNAALGLNRLFASATEDHRNGRSLMASGIGRLPRGFAAINSVASPRRAQASSASPFWAVGIGSWSNTQTDGNAPGYSANAGGVLAGFDLKKDGVSTLGVAVGYARSNLTTKNQATAYAQTERLIAYGNLTSGSWHFDGELSAAADQFGSERLIQIGALTRTAKGDTSGWAFAADAGVHYGSAFAVPFVEARYDYVSRSGFTETAAGDLSLIVDSANLDTPRVLAGLDIDLNRMVGDAAATIALNIRLAWAHDFSRIDGRTDAALTGSPAVGFTALSSQVGLDAGIANVSASAHLDNTLSLFTAYHIEGRTRQIAQSVELGLRAEW